MREDINQVALDRIQEANPVLIDVQIAKDVIPGMTDHTILHSGPPIEWSDMFGGQRNAIIGACIHEGLASSEEEADQKIRNGEIIISPCQNHDAIGSLTGVYYPSMPVFVVENKTFNNRAFCSIYEGSHRERLTYGVYNDRVKENLKIVEEVVAPILKEVVLKANGIELKPIMARALRMGDELHSRNLAATTLFLKEITPYLLSLSGPLKEKLDTFFKYYYSSDLFFLHLGMAASKSTANSIYNMEGCSIVTAMALNCKEFGIRVSTFGDEWFTAPIPEAEGKLFPGIKPEDLSYMGGESLITETMGLGGFAQASAFSLQDYSGGTPNHMIVNNQLMYEITIGEHNDFKIPYFEFRGVPLGIDIFQVVYKGISPVINMGLAHKDGGHAGAGILKAPMECFEKALAKYKETYLTNKENSLEVIDN